MNKVVEEVKIESMIYEIRGMEVMLDSDLAKLYQVETKRINEAVRNNPQKFPTRFSFILDKNEEENLRSKISTSSQNNIKHGGKRYNTRVFTEQGVCMLATILRSKTAIDVSIRIMDSFVKMRHYIKYNNNVLPNKILLLEEKVDKNTKRIDELFDKFKPNDIVKDKIFFKGEFYDAYSIFIDILNEAKNEIIIIDNYVDKTLLDVLKNINKGITIVSANIDGILKKKYESQYKNIRFINNNLFHDRYIILDQDRLFICGASFKDIGKKCFAIDEFKDSIYVEPILDILNN